MNNSINASSNGGTTRPPHTSRNPPIDNMQVFVVVPSFLICILGCECAEILQLIKGYVFACLWIFCIPLFLDEPTSVHRHFLSFYCRVLCIFWNIIKRLYFSYIYFCFWECVIAGQPCSTTCVRCKEDQRQSICFHSPYWYAHWVDSSAGNDNCEWTMARVFCIWSGRGHQRSLSMRYAWNMRSGRRLASELLLRRSADAGAIRTGPSLQAVVSATVWRWLLIGQGN